jgi:hypothetical protein
VIAGAPTAGAREHLLERCQHERNELIAMTAAAIAHVPHARAWTRTALTLLRFARILTMRAGQENPRN